MSIDVTGLRVAATLISFAVFLAVLAWACLPRNGRAFDEAARLPFEDDEGDAAGEGQARP